MPKYFTGHGYGYSTILDISGRPLLTYQGPKDSKPILLADRVAVLKDPTVIQTWTESELYNTRMPLATSASIKKAVGGTSTQELDHKIPLELGGSNSIANLRLENNVSGTQNTPTDPAETELAQRVMQGNISLQDAWAAMAQLKGYQLGEAASGGVQITFQGALNTILAALSLKGGGAGQKISKEVSAATQAQIAQNLAILQSNPLNLAARQAFFDAQVQATMQKTGMTLEEATATIVATSTAYMVANGQPPANANTVMGNLQGEFSNALNNATFLQSPGLAAMLRWTAIIFSSAPAVLIAGVIAIAIVCIFVGPDAVAGLSGVALIGGMVDAFGVSTTAGLIAGAALIVEILGAWAFIFAFGVKELYDTQVLAVSQMAQVYKTLGTNITSNASTPPPPQVYANNSEAVASNAGTNIAQVEAPAFPTAATVSSAPAPSTPTTSSTAVAGGNPAPHNAPSGNIIIAPVSSGVIGNASAFTPRPLDSIESATDLTTAAQNNLAAYLTALPGVLGYEITLATSVVADDGSVRFGGANRVVKGYTKKGVAEYKNVTNKFAVLEIYYVSAPRKRVILDKITLGPIDETTYTPSKDDLAAIISHLQSSFVLAEPGTSTLGAPATLNPQTPASQSASQTDTTSLAGATSTLTPTAQSSAIPACSATTLWDFYAAQGQPFPSIVARSALYEQLGLGTAPTYTATAEQNTKLLQALQAQLGCFVQQPSSQPAAAAEISPVILTPPAAAIPQPTAAQLAARLNPQTVTIYVPSNGVATGSGTPGETLYLGLPDGSIATFPVVSILSPQEITDANTKAGNALGAITLADQRFLAQYGFDPSTLPQVNTADLDQSLIKAGKVNPQNGEPMYAAAPLSLFINAKPATLQATTL